MSSTELKTLRKPKGIMHKLPLEFWIAGILTILQSSEKILIPTVKISDALLQNLRMRVFQKRELLFPDRQKAMQFCFG
jgi:hypothetical protein